MPFMLFVDNDHPQWDPILKQAGQNQGWVHESVASVEEAVEELTEAPDFYDLILLDFGFKKGLSGMAGVEAVQKAAPGVPVIVFTGQDSRPDFKSAVESVRSGAWDYVLKSTFDPIQFFHSANNAVEESRLRRQNLRLKDALSQIAGGEPAFLVTRLGETYDCAFAFRLLSIGVGLSLQLDGNHDIEKPPKAATSHVGWLQTFWAGQVSIPPNQSIQIRYLSLPHLDPATTRVEILLVGTARATTEDQAREQARELWGEMGSMVAAGRDLYHFIPVNDPSVLQHLIKPFPVKWAKELAPGGRILRPWPRYEIRSAGGPQADVFVSFRHDGEASTLFTLMQQLTCSDASCQLIICLTGHQLGLEERAHLGIALHSIKQRSLDVFLPDGSTPAPTSVGEMDAFSSLLAFRAHSLTRCYCLRCVIGAESPLPTAMMNLIGTDVFGVGAGLLEFTDVPPTAFSILTSGGPCPPPEGGMIFRNLYSVAEASSVARLPWPASDVGIPGVAVLRASALYCPPNLPKEGIPVGCKRQPLGNVTIRLTRQARRQHVYVLGQTGTGKSGLLYAILRRDIEAGKGVCILDPHGDLVRQLLSIIPRNREGDLVLFNPADAEMPLGLNMLEYEPAFPQQKSFLINEMMKIFGRLYNMAEVGGPMFELYMRNTMLLLMDDPSEPATLLEVSHVFTDKPYRDRLLKKCQDPVVRDFWDAALVARGDSSLESMAPYITSKLNQFTADHYVRPIISQTKSAIDFRQVLGEKRILLVDLAKGQIGQLPAQLLGMVLVSKLLNAAMSRVADQTEREDFYLAVDEFQNFSTDVLPAMLSEGRKFGLSLILAHQNLAQLNPAVRETVLSNAANQIILRPGPPDAALISVWTRPAFSERDLLNLPNFKAVGRLLIEDRPSSPFYFDLVGPPSPVDPVRVERLKGVSRKRYGRSGKLVEDEVRGRWQADGNE